MQAQGTSFGLGRIGEPADTAAVVAFLASAEAGFITGQVIYAVGRPARADQAKPRYESRQLVVVSGQGGS